jgi:hypothetical protein
MAVSRQNANLLVVISGIIITSELKDLGSEVLKHGGKVHGGRSTHARSITFLLEEMSDGTNGELKAKNCLPCRDQMLSNRFFITSETWWCRITSSGKALYTLRRGCLASSPRRIKRTAVWISLWRGWTSCCNEQDERPRRGFSRRYR